MVEDSDEVVEIKSFAKLNLFLDVIEERKDGYHNIESIMQTISLHDTLVVKKIRKGVIVDSTLEVPGENLIEKAYRFFREQYGLDFGIKVWLVKRIPMGAGFGGGSSNAAAILKYLASQTGIGEEEIFEIALKVGSDVPFFLKCGTALVKGKGDILERLDDPPKYGVVLAVPKIRIPTSRAYSWLRKEDFSKASCSPMDLYTAYREKKYETIKRCSYNLFQKVMLREFWEIKESMRYLEGNYSPIVSMVTGSGSAVFGILPPGEGTFSFVGSDCKISSRRSKSM